MVLGYRGQFLDPLMTARWDDPPEGAGEIAASECVRAFVATHDAATLDARARAVQVDAGHAAAIAAIARQRIQSPDAASLADVMTPDACAVVALARYVDARRAAPADAPALIVDGARAAAIGDGLIAIGVVDKAITAARHDPAMEPSTELLVVRTTGAAQARQTRAILASERLRTAEAAAGAARRSAALSKGGRSTAAHYKLAKENLEAAFIKAHRAEPFTSVPEAAEKLGPALGFTADVAARHLRELITRDAALRPLGRRRPARVPRS